MGEFSREHLSHRPELTFQSLVDRGDMARSRASLVEAIRPLLAHDVLEKEVAELSRGSVRLEDIVHMQRLISMRDSNIGHGYVSSSTAYDARAERAATAFVASSFLKKRTPPRIVVNSFDEWHRYAPGALSIVGRVEAFNADSSEGTALILTDVVSSEVFTESVVRSVPHQHAAGLAMREGDPAKRAFGGRFEKLIKGLPLLMQEHAGDLASVVDTLRRHGGGSDDDARLIVVTGLLARNAQSWQNLWYNEKGRQPGTGTTLFVVAPQPFHDAMNRINFAHGHGAVDYRTRAATLAFDKPLFEKPEEHDDPFALADEDYGYYDKQGLSFEEFKDRVERYLP